MNTYTYTVIDRKGNQKRETVNAENIEEARRIVAASGKTVLSIEEPSFLSKLKVPKKVIPKDLAIFCQQMSSMLKAGVTVVDALKMVGASTDNPTLRDAIMILAEEVNKGDTLASSMQKFPQVFPFLLIRMVEAGEASGSIDNTFDRMKTQFEKSQKTKDTVKKALNYPKLLIVVCIVVLVVMCTTVLPNFVGIFEELGSELPLPTKIMMGLSDFFKNYWYICLIVVIVGFVALKLFVKSKGGKEFLDKAKLRIPVFKNLEEKTATANMARLLSTLLGSGMYMAQALEIVENTMENVVYKEALGSIKKDVLNGYSLFDAVDATNMFPPLFLNLINIGEKTGEITEMLEKSAEYFEEEVDIATQQVAGMIQPMMILIMGGMVGLMVYSIYGPMMSIYDNIE